MFTGKMESGGQELSRGHPFLRDQGDHHEVLQRLAEPGERPGDVLADGGGQAHRLTVRREVDVKLAALGSEVTRQGTDRITEIHYRRMEALLRDLGVDEEMPRVPAVFEAKVKWNLEEVDDPFKEVWCENYGSAVDNMEDIRRQVEEDIERGHVIRMDKQAAGEKFGGRLAVASLGGGPQRRWGRRR